MVHKYSDLILAKLNKIISELRRLFLVEDLVDSIKVRTHLQHMWGGDGPSGGSVVGCP